jgi:DNA-binding LacI/PurR family transcriptional regulator
LPEPRRLTQHDIARLAGVSQATVSLVLNGPASAARIAQATRARVQNVIRETGYVADPIARRMAKGRNRILGVFTYEPAFPVAHADFFTPFLFGIEEEAQARNYDLLLLTGNGAAGQRRLFADGNRLRIADGCLVLGKAFDRAELEQLVRGDFPFVAIGRRNDAGGPVPYVGGDYIRATARLVEQARAWGHRRLAYVGPPGPAESVADRWMGLTGALGRDLELVLHSPALQESAEALLEAVLSHGATAVFFNELADAVRFESQAHKRGLRFPQDISVVVLGSHLRAESSNTRFSSFDIPRAEMGRQATAMLVRRVEGAREVQQILLPCGPIQGETLGPAGAGTRTTPVGRRGGDKPAVRPSPRRKP